MIAANAMNPILSTNPPSSPQITCSKKKKFINGACSKDKKCKGNKVALASKNQAEMQVNVMRSKSLSCNNKHTGKIITQAKRRNCKQRMGQQCEIKACKKLVRCKSAIVISSSNKPSRPKVQSTAAVSPESSISSSVQTSLFEEKPKFEKFMLSLQSPLPNEHQLTLNTLVLLSSVGEEMEKELNILEKVPALLNMLLAHTGVYHDCGLRELVEQTYREAFEEGESLNFAAFWEEFSGYDAHLQQQLLWERFPGKQFVAYKLCETERGDLHETTLGSSSTTTTTTTTTATASHKHIVGGHCAIANGAYNTKENLKMMTSPSSSMVKIGNRILQVGQILRNFSFESGNASVMASNTAMLRFLLIALTTEYDSLMNMAFDITSNIAKYCVIPTTSGPRNDDCDVLSHLHSIVTNLMTSTLHCSNDRFKILRSLETIQGLTISSAAAGEDCELKYKLISLFKEKQLFERIFQLLTLKEDIILVIACLECLLAFTTEMGDQVCDNIIQTVHGSVQTLVSYITLHSFKARQLEHAVTKSTRLTAALILRNFAVHSQAARRSLKQHETHLANVSMSGCDCNGIIAHILYYLGKYD